MAGVGVPMRVLQEWLGHADYKTTLIYADYAPSEQERESVDRAFARRAVVPRGVPRAQTSEFLPGNKNPKTPPEQGFSGTWSPPDLVMGDPGLEPGTSALSERRSNRLS